MTAFHDVEIVVPLFGHVQPTDQLEVSTVPLFVTVTLAVKPPCHWSVTAIETAHAEVPELADVAACATCNENISGIAPSAKATVKNAADIAYLMLCFRELYLLLGNFKFPPLNYIIDSIKRHQITFYPSIIRRV